VNVKYIVVLFVSVLVARTAEAQGGLYEKAGVIQIKDPKALMSGSVRAEKDLFKLTLENVGDYTGHTCGCDAAGFLITKNVLATLFPGQTPSRGTLRISISEYNMDLIDSITFITGTRLNRGEYSNTESDFTIDKTLTGEEGTTTLVYERRDNGKKVKVVIDRRKLLTKDQMRVSSVVKAKIMKGTASDAEKKEFATTTQDIVRKEILQLPEGSFVYTALN
jgi:formylmethanofuran dehydrogenase subunit E